MDIAVVLVGAYMAAMLGVSGIAKLERPDMFRMTLRRHMLLPDWSIPAATWLVPSLQVSASILLVLGVVPVAAAILAAGLFTGFFVTECLLLMSGRTTECGCFGVAYRMPVTGSSAVASLVLVVIAVSYILMVQAGHTVSSIELRAPVIALYSAATVTVASRIWSRNRSRRKWLVENAWR